MLYDINLRITHEYDQPAVAGRHMLRLIPATLPGAQQCIAAALDTAPAPDKRFESFDFFGNQVIEATYKQPHDRIEFTLRARVRRQSGGLQADQSPVLETLAGEIAGVRSLSADAPHHFTPASARVPLLAETTDYARNLVAPTMTTLQAVQTIGEAIHSDMTFDAEATTVETPVQDAFAARRGVCQDFSHLMIACLRGVGVPAGYVSGFLRTIPPEGQERLQGADAMHAWVRAWCGAAMGWVEYDPTNRLFALDDHVVIARGRDYADTAPIKGVLRTSGSQSSDHSVDVVVLREP